MGRARKGAPDIGEPAATQEWIREHFAGTASAKRTERAQAKSDLRRIPESRDFRRDNPDADIHDWDKYQRETGGKGRYQGRD